MKSYELVGRMLLILENPRPQGLQICFRLTANWSNQIAVRLAKRERLAVEEIRIWRILCPEESMAYISSGEISLPNTSSPILTEDSWPGLSLRTWETVENLRTTLEYIRDNWYSVFTVPDENWRLYN